MPVEIEVDDLGGTGAAVELEGVGDGSRQGGVAQDRGRGGGLRSFAGEEQAAFGVEGDAGIRRQAKMQFPRRHAIGTGDARKASKELGKKLFEMKVEYAVKQIKGMTGR